MSDLEISGLSKRFGGVVALDDVGMTVKAGTVHGLIGPNGAGKSTLVNCIGRVIDPTAGSIRFGDRDLLTHPPHGLATLGIARTFQNLALVPQLSAVENVMVGLLGRRTGSRLQTLWPTRAGRAQTGQDRRAALDAMALLGLAQYAERPADKLPYGVRKSLEIARALCLQPRLLMLDEPTAGLNATEMDELAVVVRRLNRELGTTVLLITHHVDFLLEVASAVTVLDLGRRIAAGPPELVQTDARVKAAYLGVEG